MTMFKKILLASFIVAVFSVICSFSVSADAGMTVSYDSSTNHSELYIGGTYSVSSIDIYDDVSISKTSLNKCNNSKWQYATELWITNNTSTWCFNLEILNADTNSSLATVQLRPSSTWHISLSNLGCNNFIIRLDESYPPYASNSNGVGKTVTVKQYARIGSGTNLLKSFSQVSGRWIDLSWPEYEGYIPSKNIGRVWVADSGIIVLDYVLKPSNVSVTLYYCSPDGTRLYTARAYHISGEQITINLQQILDESEQYNEYIVAPAFYTTSGTTSETKNVYMVDVGIHYDSGYLNGKQDADKQWQSVVSDIRSESYDDGYSVGYNKGISQNTLMQEQIDNVKADYNLVTGFFDGIWTGCRNAYDTLSTVSVGGVTIGTIIFMCIVAVVLILVAKVWLK